jgi:hypothetical protein
VPLTLLAARLEEARTGPADTTLHAFRAGADWREPDWAGPTPSVGDPHAGTWRDSRSAAPGEAIEAPAQWLSAADGARTLELVMERNDMPSSRAEHDGETGALRVDWGRDVISLGPFEEQGHVESPGADIGRRRALVPGATFELAPAWIAMGRGEGDGPWQFRKLLRPPYEGQVTFNSNGVDQDRISTGAKDDMDLATVREIAPIARALGVETFILDDGWQARSGDWQPDSPEHPEPRSPRWPPRFPDDEFRAVREAIAPMRLGLWMSPYHFHNSSHAFGRHPEWSCVPTGTGLAAYNALQPEDGSNEAGLGTWSAAALPHVEERIRDAIENWGVTYFKFDFLVWLDCSDGDMYRHHDEFVAMLDRLRADHPEVTFQIDETNDYRLFPFESLRRGPSWFQNGSPEVGRMLHNVWNLSPWVPAHSLGQHALSDQEFGDWPIDTLAAAALTSHITFFRDPRGLPADVVERTGEWMRFYRAHREHFTQLVHPLLADPLDGGWTALQSWDPERGLGALLAFRQDSAEPSRRIRLRAARAGRYAVRNAPDGALVGEYTAAQLREGIEVALPPRGARVLLLDRK